MKNQYFGDINDYRKYGLLRVLANSGEVSTGVCWMLTADEGRNDGQFLRYLGQPRKWREYDPDLFDHLVRCVKVDGERNVRRMEGADVLPATSFYDRLLTDVAVERRRYFAEMLEHFRSTGLIFFDPDNGLEVRSKPLGRRGSCKYLYWHELVDAYNSGHSVLVYQHFVREERDSFISRIADEMYYRTAAAALHSFRTPHVVFFLASQPRHTEYFQRQAGQVSATWGDQIRAQQHKPLKSALQPRSSHAKTPLSKVDEA